VLQRLFSTTFFDRNVVFASAVMWVQDANEQAVLAQVANKLAHIVSPRNLTVRDVGSTWTHACGLWRRLASGVYKMRSFGWIATCVAVAL
jgi:hypothetical protein